MLAPSERKAGLLLEAKGQQEKKGPPLDEFPVVILLLTLWAEGEKSTVFCSSSQQRAQVDRKFSTSVELNLL